MCTDPYNLEIIFGGRGKIFNKVRTLLEKNFTDDERDELVRQKDKPLNTVRETLDAFREHVGEDHYKALAAGTGFSDMLDRWLRQRRDDHIDTIWDRLQERLPADQRDKITKSELTQFLLLVASV